MTSGLLRLSEWITVESGCVLTALDVILRDLRGDCVPNLQGIPACGFYYVLRSDWCLSKGRDPGFEMRVAPHLRLFRVLLDLASPEANSNNLA
jgi:hypothetical protein